MSNAVFLAYLYSSWFCFIMAWFTWLVRLGLAYLSKTLLSWKTVRATVIPGIITVLALFPPYSLFLGIIYIFIVGIVIIGEKHGNHH